MDEIRCVKLLVVLGPTASGKTSLAVAVAKRLNGAIISADSRQVYRGMDIGTGKDLATYGDIPYYLIDVVDAGEQYHVTQYLADFRRAFDAICQQGQQPILCGGTGFYIQAVLQGFDYSIVPVDDALRKALYPLPIEVLKQKLLDLPIPPGFSADTSTQKRLIRAIEIATWCRHQSLPANPYPRIPAKIVGIDPPVDVRRQRITDRLRQRLKGGLLEEVQRLLDNGIPPQRLVYYGLEYKYATQYLLGEMDYDVFFTQLNTAIHRFAKRQMTYFRKMEKDGLNIHWLTNGTVDDLVEEVIDHFRSA